MDKNTATVLGAIGASVLRAKCRAIRVQSAIELGAGDELLTG